MAKKLITNYKFVPGYVSPTTNAFPQTYNLIVANKKFIIEEVIAYINYNTVNNIPPFSTNYTYDVAKCRRDMSYVLEAYLSDLRHNETYQTVFVGGKYYNNGLFQIDGSGQPEVYAHQFLKNLVDDYVLQNTLFTTRQTTATQVINQAFTPEPAGITKFDSLATIIINVLQPNGINSLPAASTSRGYVKFIGYYQQKDILLITNTTRNTILYNFADAQNPANVIYSQYYDSDFPAAQYGNDTVTTVVFDVDTTTHLVSDTLQIYVENKQDGQIVRLNPIATDAMERMKVAIPQSMIDADFEYGIQPTKWQAISLIRNYPAQYEIPGTDQSVVSVVSDASNGTSGVGASLITVTTVGSHGFSVGTVFTIKALQAAVKGFGRAEGTFIVASVPSQTVFTYYAKSKVGTSNPTLLSSSYTQLRTASFYTGATVGQSTFNVLSNGSSGTFTTTLATLSGSSYITFSGSIPPNGSPLTQTNIPTGTQVGGTIGPGGIAAATTLQLSASIGDTSITVNNTNGILIGLSINRGDGYAVTVTNISGNTVSLSGALTSAVLGSTQTYTNVGQTSTSGLGSNATFNVTRTANVYLAQIGDNAGQGYVVNDTLTFAGSSFNGTGSNDLTITVTAASPTNSVDTFNDNLLVPGSGYSDEQGLATTGGTGTGLTVNITTLAGVITSVTVNNAGTGYSVNDTITIVQAGGSLGTIVVSSIQTGGYIQSFTVAGTPISTPSISFYSTLIMSDMTSAVISASTSVSYTSIATIQVSFASNHGFVPGNTITTLITSSGTNAQLAAGAFFVETVPTSTTITYTARAPGNIVNTLTGIVYGRPDSFYVHRPLDGGVQLGTGGPSHMSTAIRMSKKYLRYQSGKGIMYNTGALFAPSYDLLSLTASGTAIGSTITLVCDNTDHGCQVGAVIRIVGITTSGYNGQYTVSTIVDERTLRFQATAVLGATTAVLGNQAQMSVQNWHGATIRSGTFDDQNGMFWQYDGQYMSLVKRSSTANIAGTISATPESNIITGTNTRFQDQLQVGDRIVIRGMTHVVTSVSSQTQMTVAPDYRGTTAIQFAKATKTIDTVVPQSQWNLDPLDGNGASGYNLDVTKMQMIGMQWTWYGAGFIDFMLRGSDGNYTFAHRFRNSNVNTEAYMRSGNQPVRYEVINEGAKARLATALTNSSTSIVLDNSYYFPSFGTVMIDNEMIYFAGNNTTTNTLYNCQRAAALTQFVAGSNRNFTAGPATSHTVGTGVVLVSNTISPIISHWGSAFLLDGQFTTDRGYIYSYTSTSVQVGGTNNTAFLMRLAPSVSNATVGDLGEKELLNRAQLILSSISITSDSVSGGGAIVVTGVLNPVNYPTDPTKITWTTLTSSAAGGQPSFCQVANGGSVSWAGQVYTTTANIVGPITTTVSAQAFSPSGSSLTATSFGTVTQTVSAYSFGYASQTATALGFNTGSPFAGVSQNLTAQTFSGAPFGTTYQSAFSTTRSDFLITNTEYDALQAGANPILAGDTLTNATYINAGTRISSITRAYSGTNYTRIVMTANARATSTQFINITGTTTSTSSRYNSAVSQYRNDILITSANYTSFSPAINVGDSITGTNIPGGTTISSITTNYLSTGYVRIVLSQTPTGSSTAGSGNNVALTVSSPYASNYFSAISSARNDFLITQASYAALTTTLNAGDGLSATTYLTGGQTVSSVTPNFITIGGVAYARIVMNALGTSTSPAATTNGQNNVTVTVTSVVSSTYNTAISSSRSDFLVTQTQWASASVNVTDVLSATTYITGGQTVGSVTQNYITVNGTAYARVVMSTNANATSPSGAGNPVTVSTTSAATALYGSALNSTRADFLVPDSVWSVLGAGIGDVLSVNTFLTGGQTITGTTASYITIASVPYTRVLMSGNANATSTSGSGNNVTITITAAGSGSTYVNKNYLFFDSVSWLASGAVVGTYLATSVTTFPSGTAVASVATRQFGSSGYTLSNVAIGLSGNLTFSASTSTLAVGQVITVSGTNTGTGIITNGSYYIISTNGSTTATLSSTVTGSAISTSTGTPVGLTFTVTSQVYRVTFTQSSTATQTVGSSVITFQFGAAYAQPGETVFSFVNNPGNTDTLDLSQLKELTSTAIGGRGTFPNGPDVLAINVYKASGSNTNCNVIIRWQEAQA